MILKYLRPVVLILSFLCIFLNIKLNNSFFLYGTGILWIILGSLNYQIEQRKRKKAIYITFNKRKTLVNYILLLALLLSNYLLFTDTHAPGRGATTIFLAVALVITAALSRIGDHYYLFDEDGIKTRGESLDYSKITERRNTGTAMELDTNENRNEMVIRKSMLTPEIISLLDAKINIPQILPD